MIEKCLFSRKENIYTERHLFTAIHDVLRFVTVHLPTTFSTTDAMAQSNGVIKTFEIPTDGKGATISVRIVEPAGINSDNLSLATWASSLVLAGILHTLGLEKCLQSKTSLSPLPILELGAGTGLVGVTAAALLGSPAAHLTDLEGTVPGVAANIAVNEKLLVERCGPAAVRAGVLDWWKPERITYLDGMEPAEISSGTKARILLAADTVYDEEHPQLLERVAQEWLEKSPLARFVMCYPMRIAYLDHIRELWERFEVAGLEAEIEGRQTGEATNGDDELLCEYVVWKWKDL
ncbi:hypothetical protein H072_6388 [Dactylellina haptotyla CBS 200.50]|uniref:Uncharacterized protein n=1 Tax=Dactylellina haptotyla (strain CBS 200.50) TaxID=1284197 RepID=S8BKI4_DACHA|nr:hypothetical protein H072_6388 [Dactylellina haptotyla CBS 200.50]